MKHTTTELGFKEIEAELFRKLQEQFSFIMKETLEGIDMELMEDRDKTRFYLKDKRSAKVQTIFGEVEVRRNYYRDNETGDYVYLLDRYLNFKGSQGMSPMLLEKSIQLATSGVSYRHARDVLKDLLGYHVISHEGIRQHMLQTEVVPSETEEIEREMLFVEVDGLYTKSQEKNRKGREIKIAGVHQGWDVNGKRVSLKQKRHFVHHGKASFWEAFEGFLMETYDYDPTKHHLVINGDGAQWITACRDYFQHNATFVIDRFHIARDIRSIFREHPRYRAIRKHLAVYDYERMLVELNSAVGTLEDEKKEEHLEDLIRQLEKYPEALGDYREILNQKGINTEGLRPMGSAEGMMNVFAKRLKQGRSWSNNGLNKFIDVFVAMKDQLEVVTAKGSLKESRNTEEKSPKYYLEKLGNRVVDVTRNNIGQLQQSMGKPVSQALKGLRGI